MLSDLDGSAFAVDGGKLKDGAGAARVSFCACGLVLGRFGPADAGAPNGALLALSWNDDAVLEVACFPSPDAAPNEKVGLAWAAWVSEVFCFAPNGEDAARVEVVLAFAPKPKGEAVDGANGRLAVPEEPVGANGLGAVCLVCAGGAAGSSRNS